MVSVNKQIVQPFTLQKPRDLLLRLSGVRVCPEQVQLLPVSRKAPKNWHLALWISSTKGAVRQVYANDFGFWRGKSAQQEQRATVIRSDFQASFRNKFLQEISQAQYFRTHLPHQNGAIATVINQLFQRFRASAEAQFAVALHITNALEQKFRHRVVSI